MRPIALFFALSLCVGAVFASSPPANEAGRVYIDIGQAQLKKSLLALPPLVDFTTQSTVSSVRVGQEIFETLKNNMLVSGFFTLQDPKAFLEDSTKVGLKPAPGTSGGFNFANWSAIGTDYLIRAGYQVTNGDQVRLETFLYFVPEAKLVIGREYKGPRAKLREIAHRYANDVVEALTGKRGMFLSQVVATRSTNAGEKEIFVMDWDAANQRQITSYRTLSISPNWAPDGNRITFTSFAFHPAWKTRNADLFLHDLVTGKMFLVSSRRGTNSGGAFSPDGKTLYFSITQKDSPTNIMRHDIAGNKTNPFVTGPGQAMNVEPAISPDGTQIVFSSDRSGRPMIYKMPLTGGSPTRMTFAGWYNASPMWSPDGKKIVFAGFDRDKGNFDVFMMDQDGMNLKRLTSAKKPNGKGSNNEDPSFSPDGRYVMFTSDRTMKKQIYIVDLTSLDERRITSDEHNYERPKWSPFFEPPARDKGSARISARDLLISPIAARYARIEAPWCFASIGCN